MISFVIVSIVTAGFEFNGAELYPNESGAQLTPHIQLIEKQHELIPLYNEAEI